MRQLALPPSGGGGHTGMSVVEAVEIGNQDLLRFELDPEETHLGSPADHSDISSTHKDRPGMSSAETDSAPNSASNSAPSSRHSSFNSRERPTTSVYRDSAPSSTGSAYQARYKSTRTRPLAPGGGASSSSGTRPPSPPLPPPLPDSEELRY